MLITLLPLLPRHGNYRYAPPPAALSLTGNSTQLHVDGKHVYVVGGGGALKSYWNTEKFMFLEVIDILAFCLAHNLFS